MTQSLIHSTDLSMITLKREHKQKKRRSTGEPRNKSEQYVWLDDLSKVDRQLCLYEKQEAAVSSTLVLQTGETSYQFRKQNGGNTYAACSLGDVPCFPH